MTFPNKNVFKKGKLNKISKENNIHKETYAIDVHLSIVRNVKLQSLCPSISEWVGEVTQNNCKSK